MAHTATAEILTRALFSDEQKPPQHLIELGVGYSE